MNKTIFVTHNGVAYHGQIGKIKRTRLGQEDHDIFTALIDIDFGSSGQGAGLLTLDTPYKPDPDDYRTERKGTAFGLDHIMQTMKVVGVSSWEDLPGKHIVALREDERLGPIVGLAHPINDNVIIFKEHYYEFVKKWPQGDK